MNKIKTELSKDETTIYIYKNNEKIGSIELGEPFSHENWVMDAINVLDALVGELTYIIADFDESSDGEQIRKDILSVIEGDTIEEDTEQTVAFDWTSVEPFNISDIVK